MRKGLGVLIGVIICLGLLVGVAQAADKFGYINIARVFSEYQKTKDYDKVLGDKQGGYETERNKKVDEIKQFQDKMNLLSDKEKENKKTELEGKIKFLQEFDRQNQTDLRKERDDRMKEIFKDLEVTVQGVAQKEGYTYIFNDTALVYKAPGSDLTEKVLSNLGKGYKK